MEREYLYDNVKAFLIFCVVLGHILEPFLYGSIKVMYIIIYSFHMPLFVFCSGMFARFAPDRIIKKIVMPYVAFQLINCIGDWVLEDGSIQFTTPVWTLWYLPALFVWTMLIPFIDRAKRKTKILILTGAFAAGLIAGYDGTIGYYMSLSRIIVFLPYFIMGFYYNKSERLKAGLSRIKPEYMIIAGAAVLLLICFVSEGVNPKWLYNAYTYSDLNYNMLYRLFIYGCGIILSAVILKVFPKRKTCFSYIGQRSLQIFLLHGFAVRILAEGLELCGWMNEAQLIAASVFFAGLIVWILSFNFNMFADKRNKRKKIMPVLSAVR